jgi:hypothetical protein
MRPELTTRLAYLITAGWVLRNALVVIDGPTPGLSAIRKLSQKEVWGNEYGVDSEFVDFFQPTARKNLPLI